LIFSEVKRHLFPFFLLTAIAFYCAETQEEYFNDPTIRVQFINADSLAKLEGRKSVVESTLDNLEDTLKFFLNMSDSLQDGLDTLNDLVNEGRTEYEELRGSISEDSIKNNIQFDFFEGEDSVFTEERLLILNAISTIESGDLLISSITNLENGFFLSFVDSAADYFLPMSMNADISRLAVEINNKSYNIELAYFREDFRDEKKRIRVSISNLEIVNHDFDSISCQSLNCENETPVKFYF
jgi:hypothetical protein